VNREELKNQLIILAIGDTIHVCDETTVESIVKPALNRGEVVLRDGTRTWIQETVRFDPRREGSDRYTWDSAGDRVLHDRVLVTVDQAGDRHETRLRPAWRRF
jgi:hypothetical protein